MELIFMGCFFIILILLGIVFIFHWMSESIIGKDRWCDNCNSWSVMRFSFFSYFKCKKCGRENPKNRGCPVCGWYGRFEDRYVGRVGPYSEMMEYGSYLLMYRETWNCPRHGNYSFMVPASQSYDSYDN